MRSVLYSVAASLDGYIAGPNGEFDWIPDEPAIDWETFMGRFDTVLMGRRTYDIARVGQSALLPGMRTFVFSRTLRAEDHPGVTMVGEDAARTVEVLRSEPGKDIWLMGGGVLFESLLEAGLIDGVEVGLAPILLGGGLPMLPACANQTLLELTSTQRYDSGIVMLSYAVRRETS